MGFWGKIKKGVSRAARGVGKFTKGAVNGGFSKVAKGAVKWVNDKTGGFISGAYNVVKNLAEKAIAGYQSIQAAISKLPFGEEILLIAKLTNPELMALDAAIATTEAGLEFASTGNLDAEFIIKQAITKKVPGADKLQTALTKFDQGKQLVNDLRRDLPNKEAFEAQVLRMADNKLAQSLPSMGLSGGGNASSITQAVNRAMADAQNTNRLQGVVDGFSNNIEQNVQNTLGGAVQNLSQGLNNTIDGLSGSALNRIRGRARGRR